MSNRQLLDPSGRNPVPQRPTPSRPPIQWPSRAGTQTNQPEATKSTQSTDNQRATALVRQHVDRVYSQEETRSNQPEEVPASSAQSQLTPIEQQNSTDQQHIMRNQPYDWQKYHTAWQQYYHQYFYQYYAGWWQQQQKQQIKENIPNSQIAKPSDSQELSDQQRVAKELRQRIRGTITKRAKKIKKSSHFKPILAAATVAILFLFINYNQVLVGAIKQYIAPGDVVTTPVIVEPNTQTAIGPAPKIIIPKIGVDAPVVYDQPSVAEADFETALERGVVRLGTTADPGTKGNVVIGGHSSNNIFNPGKYKYVFVNLKKLDVGDIFYLNYNSVRYTYKVTVAKKIIPPTDTSVLAQTTTPTVTLFTCDPPGTNVNRLIVQAVQIDPNPDGAATNTNQKPVIDKTNPLPSVAPSIWDKLFR